MTLVEQATQEAMGERATVVRPPSGNKRSVPSKQAYKQVKTEQKSKTTVKPNGGRVRELDETGGKGKAGSRSGYAADRYPDRLTDDELAGKTVPIASEKGAQRGRVPPAQRKSKTHYTGASAEEASANAHKRLTGELPPIEGGINTQGADLTQYDDERMDTVPATPESSVSVPVALEAEDETHESANLVGYEAPAAPLVTYLNKRSRVSFTLENGMYSVPAIDVVASQFGVIILLPAGSQDAIFTPNPGAKLDISWQDKSWSCYFPGTVFELPELGVMVLTMIRSDDGSDAQE